MKLSKTLKREGVSKVFSSLKGKILLEEFPLLPLRELVLFPQTMVPVFITYKAGINAIDETLKRGYRLFAVCQKRENTGETYAAGTVGRIIQHLRLPDNTFRVVLQGEYRAIINSFRRQNDPAIVRVEPITASFSGAEVNPETAGLMRAVQKSFAQYAELSKKISVETLTLIEKIENAERLANVICNAMAVKVDRKIELISIFETGERLEAILETLELENEIFGIRKNINGKVKTRMEKNQREYILHEQLKEINKELGKEEEEEDEFADLERSIVEKNPPHEVLLKARKELTRLRKLQPFSPEAGVLRGYLEWIADLPWSRYSVDLGDLKEAERILDEDHFAMRKAKDRILEFIAVRQLSFLEHDSPSGGAGPEISWTGENSAPPAGENAAETESLPEIAAAPEPAPPSEHGKPSGADISADPGSRGPEKKGVKGPILCFAGPPGTGKTSLGRSVARALGRRFIRISLGGVRDEAEIRGHRKTYVGALPGKIIQSMRKAETMNPVFLLDEIDKLSCDFRGDPASALLEVLDPEQNSSFTDHYMEVPYDLSKALFITTANSLHAIPYPLLDRMEIIEIPGYGENEKLAIARHFLIPKELNENGLGTAKITFKDETVREIIRHWTMESGVRGLEREIARCIRRTAREALKQEYGKNADKPLSSFKKNIRPEDLEKLLGRHKYKNDVVFKEARIGVTYGLAWTETGGTMLPVETIRFEGNGELIITGNLGDVMKESARIALSYLRSVQDRCNFSLKDMRKIDFHIHIPEGAIPKDGPSAGLTLAASLLSTLCGLPPKPAIAMTGELTLTGRVLPIGGLKEKLLAAIRNGINRVLLPEDNREDWAELDKEVKDAIAVDFVENAEDAFRILFDKKIWSAGKRKPAGAKKTPPLKK
jgi:ATP-dependent Lon protease